MSDLITIHGLEIWTHIGWPDEERAHKQLLRVTVAMKVKDVTAAAETADLSKTVNYFDVSQKLKAVADEKPRRLIETLAEDFACCVLTNFPVKRVTIEVEKYILPDTRSISLKIERKAVKKPKAPAPKPRARPTKPPLTS